MLFESFRRLGALAKSFIFAFYPVQDMQISPGEQISGGRFDSGNAGRMGARLKGRSVGFRAAASPHSHLIAIILYGSLCTSSSICHRSSCIIWAYLGTYSVAPPSQLLSSRRKWTPSAEAEMSARLRWIDDASLDGLAFDPGHISVDLDN